MPLLSSSYPQLSVHSDELVIAATTGLSAASLQAAAPWELLLLVRDLAKTNSDHGTLDTFPAHRWTPAILEMANMKWPDRKHAQHTTTGNSSSSSLEMNAPLPLTPDSRHRYDNPLTWLSNMSHSLAMLGDRGKGLLPTFYTAVCRNSGHMQSLHPAELVAVAAGLAASGARCDRIPSSSHPTTFSAAGMQGESPSHESPLHESRAAGGERGLQGGRVGNSDMHKFLHDLCDLTVAGVGSLTANEAADAVEVSGFAWGEDDVRAATLPLSMSSYVHAFKNICNS